MNNLSIYSKSSFRWLIVIVMIILVTVLDGNSLEATYFVDNSDISALDTQLSIQTETQSVSGGNGTCC